MLTTRLNFRRAARILRRGGFTLVELLVVIGIIAILAGVALGPITNGIKKAKQSSGMQTAHVIGLAMYSYANDNSQTYPDNSGSGAGGVAQSLIAGGYISDPAIFFISGGLSTKYTGTAASAGTAGGIASANVSWDFAGNGGSGLSSTNYQYLPVLWSSIKGGTEPTLGTASGDLTALPISSNPFSTDGMAVFFINNSSKFVNGQLGTVTMVPSANNTGGAPATVPVNTGGG